MKTKQAVRVAGRKRGPIQRGWALMAKTERTYATIAIWPTRRAVEAYMQDCAAVIQRRKPRMARIEYRIVPLGRGRK